MACLFNFDLHRNTDFCVKYCLIKQIWCILYLFPHFYKFYYCKQENRKDTNSKVIQRIKYMRYISVISHAETQKSVYFSSILVKNLLLLEISKVTFFMKRHKF
jgi:hypothetical protein